ncbi:hypothetical protein T440DRAFT_515754 [Plenodomus tracheiphilus IPT5]|uniref:Uncharacterized protein n=1 Tax=Plenodomus tracheiphilus IPT5 TaxID=1408161 RepID=A0A6A7BEF8_9PLEO|nr:hypothetical protein T440DRAFT_515754 [Plenodomus tracheiphilus IPT5]
MANGKTEPLVSGACWPIASQAVSAKVNANYRCNFSIWKTCDAGRLPTVMPRAITSVPIPQAKGYWCSQIQF